MTRRTAVDAAKAFLDVLWADAVPSDAQLSAAVDRLLAAEQDVQFVEGPSDSSDPPPQDFNALYQQLGARFPQFGFYARTDPLVLVDGEITIGDAIDDLADLTMDLRNVLWLADHRGIDQASRYFCLYYEVHWGAHARELALFLHAHRFRAV
jgi:hypothetical protein